jgi:hypothetical protein
MKKSLTALLALAMMLTVSLDASAQFKKRENNRKPDRFHMGLRAGLTASTLTGDHTDDVKAFWFPYGGIGLDFQVAPIPIFIETGLNYMNRGFKVDYNEHGHHYSWTYDTAHSLHMPLVVSYHANIGPNLFLQPFLGGFMAYNLDEIDKEKSDWQDERFDYGLRFGLGFNFGRLYANFGYDLGLKNLSGNSNHSIHSGEMFATIGFNWAGSR